MATITHRSSTDPRDVGSRRSQIDLFSLALLFLAIAALALGLVGVAVRGSTPLGLAPGLALGVYAILHLRK